MTRRNRLGLPSLVPLFGLSVPVFGAHGLTFPPSGENPRYDPKDDALRVKTKAAKSEYHEWLTYEFTEPEPAKTTLALKWEELQVPFSIEVENPNQFNAKRSPNQWPVHVGLMRGYAAMGDKKKALAEAKLAVAQAPDEGNRKNLQGLVKQLEEGKDIN
jgi:hypothetical protein